MVTDGFKQGRDLTQKYAKTFYFASRFLGAEKRRAAYSVYSICRISDETVDSTEITEQPLLLASLKDKIELSYGDKEVKDKLLLAFRHTVKDYKIPHEYFKELLEGMYMDLDKDRYDNFTELYYYCYKVAGVVGLIMLKIFGYDKADAEKHAVNLGIAMQLTNILRDIKEDLKRGRIYLPRDEMKKFGITEQYLSNEVTNHSFESFLKFQIERARQYYTYAAEGIKMINCRRSRFVVCAMKDMYAAVLGAIERNKYDVFSRRAHVSTAGKLGIALRVLLGAEYL